jgi:putative ATPase
MQPGLAPLADSLRPTKLSQVVGQEHLTGKGKLLERLVASNHLVSLIFWGPPGSGKTTLARIIASEVNADFIELSAVNSGKKEVMKIIEKAKLNHKLNRTTVLFVDEIHRFNKAQQDAFLPYVENGTITLIGATTENPSFEVISALLSRCQVVTLNPLSKESIVKIIQRATRTLNLSNTKISRSIINLVADLSDGDGRNALNLLETSLHLSQVGPITEEVILSAAQRPFPLHDKKGEAHYNLISALIKSLRAGDINASFYYMARMLQAGDDPKFISRRMIIFASEDIGMAAPAALNLTVSTFLAVERIGLPECRYNLFHCAAVLAKAPKSRQIADAMGKALTVAESYPNLPVPLHLRNAPTKLMKDLGYNKGYRWQAGFKHENSYLPPEIQDLEIFKD